MKLRYLTFIVLLVALARGYYGWYKPGVDRAQCILNIRNAHHTLRAYEGITGKYDGESVDFKEAFRYLDKDPNFSCPTGGTYDWVKRYSAPMGTPYLRCSHKDHNPPDTSGW